MSEPVTPAEAKLFLRVEHEAEDELIEMLLQAARERVEAATGLTLDDTSPAALRLVVLKLAQEAHERDGGKDASLGEAWLAPWRAVRL